MLYSGQVLGGKYRIEKALGQGDSGRVYAVRHLTLDQTLAVKVWSRPSLSPEESKALADPFSREARLLASLTHPGLPRVFDLFHEETRTCLVMEMIPGQTLAEMAHHQPLGLGLVAKLAAQVLHALHYLHGRDPAIVVRDLKPEHLMVTPEGRVKLIDFGLAESWLSPSSGPDPQGREEDPFAALEQYGEGVVEARSDLYGLGATLYFALSGEAPPAAWRRASLQEPLVNLRERNASLTETFWNGVQALLELDVEARPRNAREAWERLELGPSELLQSSDESPERLLKVAFAAEQRLGSAKPYEPFQPEDWILKVVQAATRATAREVRVVQTRSACRVQLAIPPHTLPDVGTLLEALTEKTGTLNDSWLLELVIGLRMVGEFRDFTLHLDNWKRAWRVESRSGRLEATPTSSDGRAQLTLEVPYLGKAPDRARQAAEEMVALATRTRLCPFPLYIDDRRLTWERPIEKRRLAQAGREVYLASVCCTEGEPFSPPREEPTSRTLSDTAPLAELGSEVRGALSSHLDIRGYFEPVMSRASAVTGFSFLRQPLRLFWYRHGVLCGQQEVEGWHSLEVLVHLDGNHLSSSVAGLKVEPVEFAFPLRHLRPLARLETVLNAIAEELERYQPSPPEGSSRARKAALGVVATPLLVLLFGSVAAPVLLKSALASGLVPKAAALGGLMGYMHQNKEEELLRRACLKAVRAYEL